MNNKEKNVEETTYLTIRDYVIDAKREIYRSVNSTMVMTYWNIGKTLYEVCGENERAPYGKHIIEYVSEKMTQEFGKGYSPRNLGDMKKFYFTFPILQTVSAKLSWSHYVLILRVESKEAREFYVKEAGEAGWSVRQLERQINTFYYQRLLSSKNKIGVSKEIEEKEPKNEYENIIKDPYVLEFLDLPPNEHFYENTLEQALIDHMQKFLLELGKGFSFVARQKHFNIDGRHFYIDLVFYNYILKCFVLIDLKTGDLTHQDIGQMQMYVNYYTRELMNEGDNLPIGLLLSSSKSDTLVKYTLPENNTQIFAAKYKAYMPSEEDLKRELDLKQFEKIK